MRGGGGCLCEGERYLCEGRGACMRGGGGCLCEGGEVPV